LILFGTKISDNPRSRRFAAETGYLHWRRSGHAWRERLRRQNPQRGHWLLGFKNLI